MTQLALGLGKTPQPGGEFRSSLAENPNCVKHFALFPV
jgi:hypothetical protein